MKNNNNKQRLFEVIGKLDKSFKPKLNEFYKDNYQDNYVDPIQFAKQKARGNEDYQKQIQDDAIEYAGGIDNWNTLNNNEKDEVLRLVEPNMNEMFGWSQKEKDRKTLKQKIDQAKYEVSKSSPAATAFAQPGINNNFQQETELMRVRLNMLKSQMATVMELLPNLFNDNQGFVTANLDSRGSKYNGLVLSKWTFVKDRDGIIRLDGKGNTVDGHDKEYLNQQLDGLLKNTNEAYGTPDPLGSHKAKQMNEMPNWGVNKANPAYSHFAVIKNSDKIVNGWDYRSYGQSELREFKKDYFYQDIIDSQINPKDVNIVTGKYLQKKGIDPYDYKNWHKPDIDETDIYTMK